MNKLDKPLLVLDLDNTMIYCSKKPYREAQITTEHGHLAVRDNLDDFLRKISNHYDLIVWSNGGTTYVKDILELVWPKDVPLVDVIPCSRSKIKAQEGYGIPFYKDLRIIQKLHPQYKIERIVGFDDTRETYKYNFGNLVISSEYVGHPDDELLLLHDYLVALSELPNFRDVDKTYWRSGHKPIAKKRLVLSSPGANS